MTQQELNEIVAKKDYLEKKVLALLALCKEKDETVERIELNLNQSTSAIYQLNLALNEREQKIEQLELEVRALLRGEQACRITADTQTHKPIPSQVEPTLKYLDIEQDEIPAKPNDVRDLRIPVMLVILAITIFVLFTVSLL